MKTMHTMAVAAAVVAAAGMFNGCSSVDESAPSHPRTVNVLTPDENAKENADKRILETPGPAAPSSAKEFPGQSRAPSALPVNVAQGVSGGSPTMLMADYPTVESHVPLYRPTNTPMVEYYTDNYHGSVPHLAEKPGMTPAVGTEAVPNTPWMIDNSWGEVLPMQNYPHRPWQETNGNYYSAEVKNDPTYYFHIQQELNVPQNDGSVVGDIISTAYEVPWFLANTAALPVLMVLDPPLHQRRSESASWDPIYNGYLPPQGDIVATPTPGVIHWEFVFDKKSAAETQPATTSGEPATSEAPGLDKSPSPADSIPSTPAPAGQ